MGSDERDESEAADEVEGDPGSSEAPISGQPGGGLDGNEGDEARDGDDSGDDEE